MRENLRNFIPLFILTLIIAACSGEGLFYTIENEEKIVDNNMENVKFNKVIVIDGTSDYYVALGSRIWYREISGSNWNVLSLPGSASHISSMVLYNNDILYTVRTGDGSALYKIDDPGTNGMNSGTLVANSTTGPAGSGNFMNYRLFADSDGSVLCLNMFETEDDDDLTPYSSALYTASTGDITDFSDFTLSGSGLDLNNKPVKSMAFDAGSNAWLIYNDIDSGDNDYDDLGSHGVLISSTDDFSSISAVVSGQGSGYYQTVHYDTTNSVLLLSIRTEYASGGSSFALSYYFGSTWTTASWEYGFNDFLFDTNLTAGDNYIIGCTMSDYVTSGDGYTLLNISDIAGGISSLDDSDIIADEDNYSSSDLIDSAIYSMDIYLNGSDYILLAGTSSGIWTLNSTTMVWSQE